MPCILTDGAASESLDMRPCKYALLLALVAAVIALDPPGVHAAPSFDCKRASSIAEKEICGLPEARRPRPRYCGVVHASARGAQRSRRRRVACRSARLAEEPRRLRRSHPRRSADLCRRLRLPARTDDGARRKTARHRRRQAIFQMSCEAGYLRQSPSCAAATTVARRQAGSPAFCISLSRRRSCPASP